MGIQNRANMASQGATGLATLRRELGSMRERAATQITKLTQAAEQAPAQCTSWVTHQQYDRKSLGSDANDRAFFDQHGFLHIKGFASAEETEGMLNQMSDIIEDWEPTSCVTFRTDDQQEGAQASSDYFMSSSDKVHFFTEVDATDESGALLEGLSKHESLNKVGHGLHLDVPQFGPYSTSDKVGNLARSLGWNDPVIPQSMYIFKQPRIGGEITSHQDSCFLWTEPRQSCLGLWLALHDANLENGCLWVRPGSHTEPVRRRFARKANEQEGMEFIQQVPEEESVAWEGKLPDNWQPAVSCEGLFEAGFIPVEVKAGDVLVFAGQLDHLSLPNFSSDPRHTFQLHLVEGPNAGVEWSDSNWLQYPNKRPFLRVAEQV